MKTYKRIFTTLVFLIVLGACNSGNTGSPDIVDYSNVPKAIAGSIGYLAPPVTLPSLRRLEKSKVLYTYGENSNLSEFNNFGASGIFWGHMIEKDLYNDGALSSWISEVSGYRGVGLDYMARGEFDWGWRWFIDFEDNPNDHFVRNLNGDVVVYSFMGTLNYEGYPNGWLSNHSPLFVDYFKSQVDRMFEANISYIMFDSQTSSTRSTDMNQFGGDFSTWAMDGFREYMREKYTESELEARSINDIDSFNYRNYLIAGGYSDATYKREANTINGGVPLFDDFIYFNRKVLNEKMDEVFSYIRSIDPDIEIGATTSLMEARGYIYSEDLSFLAAELAMYADHTDEMPLQIISHLKAAEAVGKTLVYFPYPWEFANLRDRNAPAHARTWIAQSYAMGAIFSIPANVWVGGSPSVWQPGADNYRDLYQFVSENPSLLDGYKSYSKVGLVAPVMASLDTGWIDGSDTLQSSIAYLIENNLNFDLLIFGDPGNPIVPRQEDLNKYDTIIVDSDKRYLIDAQDQLLNHNFSKILDINNNSTEISALKLNHISASVSGSPADDRITALSKIHSTDPNAPYIIQLLNRPLNSVNGTTPVLDNVSIAIPKSYFPEDISQVTLYLPGTGPSILDVTSNETEDYVVNFDNLGVWGTLELTHSSE